jgi:hypothetical protein
MNIRHPILLSLVESLAQSVGALGAIGPKANSRAV